MIPFSGFSSFSFSWWGEGPDAATPRFCPYYSVLSIIPYPSFPARIAYRIVARSTFARASLLLTGPPFSEFFPVRPPLGGIQAPLARPSASPFRDEPPLSEGLFVFVLRAKPPSFLFRPGFSLLNSCFQFLGKSGCSSTRTASLLEGRNGALARDGV